VGRHRGLRYRSVGLTKVIQNDESLSGFLKGKDVKKDVTVTI